MFDLKECGLGKTSTSCELDRNWSSPSLLKDGEMVSFVCA